MNAPFRAGLTPVCNTDRKVINKNIKMSRRYQYVTFRNPQTLYPAAVVGGGPSTKANLDVLRQWVLRGGSDIYAINDTAGYLSDNGIPSYLFSIDCTEVPFKIGPLVKGAVFASRVHRSQYLQFNRRDARLFHTLEDAEWLHVGGGIEGGGTSVCRSPVLMLRMGYSCVYYFGCEGSFYDFSHVSGKSEEAFHNMIVISAGGIDYITNAAFVIQSEYLSKKMRMYPTLLKNASGGLLQAMIEHWDTWEFKAIGEDLRKQYHAKGPPIWTNNYDLREHKVWTPGVNNANTN